MILIAGIPAEGPVRLVIEAADEAGIEYVVFNQHHAHTYQLSISCLNNQFHGVLRIDGNDYPLESFDGIFVRIMDLYSLPERTIGNKSYVGEELAAKSDLIHQYLLHWLDITDGRVMNRPHAGLSNLSKPYQAQLIAQSGFKVPATCITNNEIAARNFKKDWGNIIYKSISSARSIVKELDGVGMLNLSRIRYLPTQFQQKMNGVNIRVHVAGDVLFATKAETEVVDYRYAGQEGGDLDLSVYTLPKAIEEQCFELSRNLNLPLCGIDLFLTENGEFYCFEVNPSPGYSFFQEGADQNIAGAIVQWLALGTAQ